MSTANVLLLNADYRPIRVIPWERAVTLLFDDKVWLVHEYAERVLHSASEVFAWPSVIAHKRFHKVSTRVRFCRANVHARDQYTCQYCGEAPVTRADKPDTTRLTIDHVVPRAQSRNGRVTLPWNGKRVSVTSWENCVTACRECNLYKGARTPAEAGYKLRALPRRPLPIDAVLLSLKRHDVPDEWKDYLPKDSEWREYWDAELDPA